MVFQTLKKNPKTANLTEHLKEAKHYTNCETIQYIRDGAGGYIRTKGVFETKFLTMLMLSFLEEVLNLISSATA